VIYAGDIQNEFAASRLKDLGDYLDSAEGPVKTFSPSGSDIDSFIEPIVVISGKRVEIEQEQIPDYFWPVTGKWRMRDLHKVFVDDESYNSGHGRAYDFYGVDPKEGAVVVVRPDQYVAMVSAIENHQIVGEFFQGFAIIT